MKFYIICFLFLLNLGICEGSCEMPNYFFDENHVRYELAASNEGKPYNWLFLPGGPGADSRFYKGLIERLKLPGNVWLIDLPGSGDNTNNISDDYNYDKWIDIFVPTIKKFKNPILVGHSFGGMFPLLFPELEKYLKGFVILHSTPSLWLEEAVKYSKQFDLPDLSKEMQEFTLNPNQSTFDAALKACMPYYFPKKSLKKAKELFSDIPFHFRPAVWWQKKVIEMNFSAKWIPQNVPTLIVGGKYDCMCPFLLFTKDKRFQRTNIKLIYLEDAGHIGWVENPEAYIDAFNKIYSQIENAEAEKITN